MSISSFAPATRTVGWLASLAIAGSFCLFCENGLGGLPFLTSTSGLKAPAVPAPAHRTPIATTGTRSNFRIDHSSVWLTSGAHGTPVRVCPQPATAASFSRPRGRRSPEAAIDAGERRPDLDSNQGPTP